MRKPDYQKWLKIRLAKDENPDFSVRTLQKRLKTSPNTIQQALEKTKDEIEALIAMDPRYESNNSNDNTLEPTENSIVKRAFTELLPFFDDIIKSVSRYGNESLKQSLRDRLNRMNLRLIDQAKEVIA